MPFRQNVLTKGLVPVELADIVNGTIQSPTGYPVSLAFMPPGVLPLPIDFVPATWAPTADGGYAAQVLVGPSDLNPPVTDVTLSVGTFSIWAQLTITDNAGQPQEVQVTQVDTITIGGANSRVPVVTIADMAAYMGYPFTPDQYPAVSLVLDDITAQLERWLHADLSIQQFTETYTVPYQGPTVMGSNVFNSSTADVFMQLDQLNLAYSTGPVRIKHWPVISWDTLNVVNNLTTPPTMIAIPPPVAPSDMYEFVYGSQIIVTYTAGWDGPNMSDVRGAIMRAAARELTARLDDAVGLKGGMATERLPDDASGGRNPAGLTMAELGPLSRLRRRVIV